MSIETSLHATWHIHLLCFPERTAAADPFFFLSPFMLIDGKLVMKKL